MAYAQQTVFEKTNGRETATYFEVIEFYKSLAKKSSLVKMETKGLTDAGYPLHLILISNDKIFDPAVWHRNQKAVLMINNGIHPGEPDGIDASMLLVRDIVNKKILLPDNVALGIIPVYNIGGALNRNRFSRVNQDGPAEYGFRGNAQNQDLNRDFTKNDTKNAQTFAEIFHFLNPDILVDTHVSDGADYQYTMTLITTQYNKQGPLLGDWVKKHFEPALFESMKKKGQEMVPYVNVEETDPSKGFTQFNDGPRYSSGYAALFNTVSFMPETHMLKPYKDRTTATYELLVSFIENCGQYANDLISVRKKAIENIRKQKQFPLSWSLDRTQHTLISFKGYEAGKVTSKVTGLPVLIYDHQKPYNKKVKFYDVYKKENSVSAPKAYVIPQGWWKVIDLLVLNGVKMEGLKKDSVMEVNTFRIKKMKAVTSPYEGHYKNTQIEGEWAVEKISFLKGDKVIYLNQAANRYLVEMLEPLGEDSFLSWNFFDGIMQQKEYFSDYRFNPVAEEYLDKHPELRKALEDKKKSDPAFAKNSSAQLDFVYKYSPWYEPTHKRYPVYRLEP